MHNFHGFQLIIMQVDKSTLVTEVVHGLDHSLKQLLGDLITVCLDTQANKQPEEDHTGR
jgi:hypothetical protein